MVYAMKNLLFCHVALHVEADHFRPTVGAHCDALLEVSGNLASTVIGHLYRTLLAGGDGGLRVFGDGATTTGNSLVDYQWSVTHVGEGEGAFLHGIALGKLTEIVCQLVEFDIGLFLGGCIVQCAEQQQCHHNDFTHGYILFVV